MVSATYARPERHTRPFPMAAAFGLAAVCASGVAVVLAATVVGVGISPDATTYLRLAQSLLTAFGLAPADSPATGVRFSAEVPPVYSAALAAAAAVLQQDPPHAARWLGAVLLGANLGALGLLLRRVSGRPVLWVLGPVLMLGVRDILVVHTNALTEPLFLLLLTLGFLELDRHLATSSSASLVAVAVTGAVASLTRFAGPAFVATASVAVALWGGESPRRRAGAAAFVAAALVPMLAWSFLAPGYRAFALHVPPLDYFLAGWDTIALWAIPEAVPLQAPGRRTAAAALIGIVLFAPLFVRGPGRAATDGSRMTRCLWVFSGGYLLLLTCTRLFWDAANLLNGRLLSPLVVPGIVLTLTGFERLSPRQGFPSPLPARGRLVWWVLAGAWILAAFITGSQWVAHVHDNGQWYGSRQWRESPVMRAVRALPPNALLVSNGNDAVTAVTGRPSLRLPDRINPATLGPNPGYESAMAALYKRLGSGGFVVYLDVIGRERPYIPSEAEMLRVWDLTLVADTEDGAIYRPRRASDRSAEP